MAKRKKKFDKIAPVVAEPVASSVPSPVVEVKEGLSPRERLLFWSLLVFGAVIRFFWLGHASYMIDEINVVRDAASQSSYVAIFNTEVERFSWYHRLPLLMFIMRSVFKVIGYSGGFPPEWLSRLPFAIFGTLALPLFYQLGKTLKNKSLGLWCMFLATISVFHTYYSREAYDYSMVVFFSAGTLWMGVELLQREFKQTKAGVWFVAGYLFFSIGLLQSHLSGLLFLAPLNALMFLLLLFSPGGLKGKQLGRWLVMMGAAYLLFVPFLLRLSGFAPQEATYARRFMPSTIPVLLGRMGWGESLWVLAPFAAFLLAGLVSIRRARERAERFPMILLAVQLLAYFAIQSFMLRISRFEVRYYSALFPLLILFVALGIDYTVQWMGRRFPRTSPAAFRLAVAVPLFLWLAPSLWSVCALQTRGYNYKGIAAWINKNIPPNGTYSFYNIYELRGVPNAYPTPGRTATSVGAWSTTEDYKRAQPVKRTVSLFTRFPQIRFIEIAPDDLLAPEVGAEPLPREQLFMRHEWLLDPAWDRLLQLRTFPPSEVQLNATNISRTLISWNEPEDLPALAKKLGRELYHYFGDGWQYARDQQMNDWMVLQSAGSLYLGNAGTSAVTGTLRISAMAPSGGAQLTITDAKGAVLLDHAQFRSDFQNLAVTNIVLPSGASRFDLQVLPPPNGVNGPLAVYSVGVTPNP